MTTNEIIENKIKFMNASDFTALVSDMYEGDGYCSNISRCHVERWNFAQCLWDNYCFDPKDYSDEDINGEYGLEDAKYCLISGMYELDHVYTFLKKKLCPRKNKKVA